MGIGGIGNFNAKKAVHRNTDGAVSRTVSYSISQKNQKKYKKLKYNFKTISGEILRTKTSMSARSVMTRAKGITAMLRRSVGIGVYDEEELRHAIIHAQKMERVAKKRMRHLQEEENIKRKSASMCQDGMEPEEEAKEYGIDELQYHLEMDREEMRELIEEIQEMVEQIIQETEGMDALEELTGGAGIEMDPEDLDLLRKKHRSDEVRDILEADLKYLKAFFGKLERERQAASSGVSYESQSQAGRSAGASRMVIAASTAMKMLPTPDAVSAAAAVEAGGGSVDVLA